MKFGINNPAFLQAAGAGAIPESIVLKFITGVPNILVSSVGGFSVKYMFNGVEQMKHYESGANIAVHLEIDLETPIWLIGKITHLSGTADLNWFESLASIDVSNAKSLEDLWVNGSQISTVNLANNTNLKILIAYDCNYLGNLDLSKNPHITELSISRDESLSELNIMGNVNLERIQINDVTSMTKIKAWAVNEVILDAVVGLIGNSTASDGIVTLRTGDPFNENVAMAAQQKGWTVEYVDA